MKRTAPLLVLIAALSAAALPAGPFDAGPAPAAPQAAKALPAFEEPAPSDALPSLMPADVERSMRAFLTRPPAPASQVMAKRSTEHEPKVWREIEYGRAGGVSLRLDLYYPRGTFERLRPAVLFIHGGGWGLGDKADGTEAADLARHGFVTASINYRLSWQAKFPAAVEDCKAAVRWMRANARRMRVDPERIGVWGASAGGHLAMMVGFADARAGLEGASGSPGVSSRVRAVCSYFGPADLAGRFSHPLTLGGQIVHFFMGPFRPRRDFELASPVRHVTRDDPPLLLVHGDRDWLVPLEQSTLMARACRKAGVEATLIRVRNAEHGFAPSPISARVTPAAAEREQAVVSFFRRHLAPRPPRVASARH